MPVSIPLHTHTVFAQSRASTDAQHVEGRPLRGVLMGGKMARSFNRYGRPRQVDKNLTEEVRIGFPYAARHANRGYAHGDHCRCHACRPRTFACSSCVEVLGDENPPEHGLRIGGAVSITATARATWGQNWPSLARRVQLLPELGLATAGFPGIRKLKRAPATPGASPRTASPTLPAGCERHTTRAPERRERLPSTSEAGPGRILLPEFPM